jgi:hypothetical protein
MGWELQNNASYPWWHILHATCQPALLDVGHSGNLLLPSYVKFCAYAYNTNMHT